MTTQQIINKLNLVINKIYLDDKYLLECEVCERCLMFRFAYYLQLEFLGYFVDCEFNKMGFNGYKSECKVEPARNGIGTKIMYADIIVHKRDSDTKNNLLCIELKIDKNGILDDFERLKNMTNQDGFISKLTRYVYGYKLGVSVYLPVDKDNLEMKYFINGEEIDEQVLRQVN